MLPETWRVERKNSAGIDATNPNILTQVEVTKKLFLWTWKRESEVHHELEQADEIILQRPCPPKTDALGSARRHEAQHKLFALKSPLISPGRLHSSSTAKITFKLFFALELNNTIWFFFFLSKKTVSGKWIYRLYLKSSYKYQKYKEVCGFYLSFFFFFFTRVTHS